MVSLKEVEPLTGYVRGGVTVFGARKEFPAYVDETLELFDVISVSAGTRGTQIVLSPGGLPPLLSRKKKDATIAVAHQGRPLKDGAPMTEAKGPTPDQREGQPNAQQAAKPRLPGQPALSAAKGP